MKFYIRKTSDPTLYWDDEPEDHPDAPCEGCTKLDKITEVKDDDYLWTIEINSLEELVELSKKEAIIVRENTIEIYDRLRE
jgi:hypothetical protein